MKTLPITEYPKVTYKPLEGKSFPPGSHFAPIWQVFLIKKGALGAIVLVLVNVI